MSDPPPVGMPSGDVTLLRQRIEQADPQAVDQILPLVYEELRKLAAAKMAREAAGQTLQPTALVHEVWLRLGGDRQPQWANRAQFFAAAVMGISETTAKRDWSYARAWLMNEIKTLRA